MAAARTGEFPGTKEIIASRGDHRREPSALPADPFFSNSFISLSLSFSRSLSVHVGTGTRAELPTVSIFSRVPLISRFPLGHPVLRGERRRPSLWPLTFLSFNRSAPRTLNPPSTLHHRLSRFPRSRFYLFSPFSRSPFEASLILYYLVSWSSRPL